VVPTFLPWCCVSHCHHGRLTKRGQVVADASLLNVLDELRAPAEVELPFWPVWSFGVVMQDNPFLIPCQAYRWHTSLHSDCIYSFTEKPAQ
jgi:hypothetical protein